MEEFLVDNFCIEEEERQEITFPRYYGTKLFDAANEKDNLL